MFRLITSSVSDPKSKSCLAGRKSQWGATTSGGGRVTASVAVSLQPPARKWDFQEKGPPPKRSYGRSYRLYG
jgi:hypothetical protein